MQLPHLIKRPGLAEHTIFMSQIVLKGLIKEIFTFKNKDESVRLKLKQSTVCTIIKITRITFDLL